MTDTIDFRFKSPDDSPGFLLWQITMLWQRKMKRELDKIAITHTQFVLLATLAWLARTKEDVTQTDIASHSKTDRMMVSKVLRTMQNKGLISRQEHHADTRAKTISLTALGQELLQKALTVVHNVDDNFFSVLESQLQVFNTGMLTLLKKNE